MAAATWHRSRRLTRSRRARARRRHPRSAPARPRLASMRPHHARGGDTLGDRIRTEQNEQRLCSIRRRPPRHLRRDRGEQGLRLRLRLRLRVQVRSRLRRARARRQERRYRRALVHRPRRPPRPRRERAVSRSGGPRLARSTRAPSPRSAGAALLSYGLISNVFYVSSLLGAMYTSCKVHALSPLVSLFFYFRIPYGQLV